MGEVVGGDEVGYVLDALFGDDGNGPLDLQKVI